MMTATDHWVRKWPIIGANLEKRFSFFGFEEWHGIISSREYFCIFHEWIIMSLPKGS